jgi:hypothetical protein
MDIISEDVFVQKFGEYCKADKDIKLIHIEEDKKSTHMDCELIYHDEYIRLEAKLFNDTRSRSQKSLLIFGGILKGRNLIKAIRTNKQPVFYGILIRYSQIKEAKRLFKAISDDDWNKFGVVFDTKYVFVYDDISDSLEVFDWKNFNLKS